MPVKILLADKSITIQKVVEMLFSGKEYEVLCVSDGDTALNEASRVIPDVVLADIDLPRVDGYTFSGRLKKIPALAETPVILMMSRDDVFDEARARHGSIIDHIAKPFESQELIGKVKKAIAAAPPRLAGSAPAPSRPVSAPLRPQTASSAAVLGTSPPVQPKAASKKQPADIFDIIEDAPSQEDLNRSAQFKEEETVYEVEPVVEVEEPFTRDEAKVLPLGTKAVEEMRAGLGLVETPDTSDQEIVNFESLDMAMNKAQEYVRPRQEEPRTPETKSRNAPMAEAREYIPPPPDPEDELLEGTFPENKLRDMAEQIVARIAREHFKNMAPPHPRVSEDMTRKMVEESVSRVVREIARDVIEKVAWEVVPDLAATLIKAEIERLKAET